MQNRSAQPRWITILILLVVFTLQPGLQTTQAAATTPFDTPMLRSITVDTAEGLQDALNNARPGDYIQLEPGIYNRGTAGFDIHNTSGTAARPIVLHGPRSAILEVGQYNGYALHVLESDHWIISGFTIRRALKGLMVEDSDYNLFHDLEVKRIGHEGIHLRVFSSHNRVEGNWVHLTGRTNTFFGEGIYLGTANSNWGSTTNGNPDRSNHNDVINNDIGPRVTAEGIDIKEGTTGGLIEGNRYSSTGATNTEISSWMGVKGNNAVIRNNVALYVENSGLEPEIKVVSVLSGWGQNNTVENNFFFNTDASGPLLYPVDAVFPAAAPKTDPNTNLTVRFTEDVFRGSGRIRIERLNGTVIESLGVNADANRISINGDTVTIDPATLLAYGTRYVITIDAGTFVDADGDPFPGLMN